MKKNTKNHYEELKCNTLEKLGDGSDQPQALFFSSLPTFKLETLSSITNKHGELLFQRLYGLRLTECRILGVVAFYAPISLRRLCIELELEKSQGSRLVAKLVESGLLERCEDPDDQRSFYLLLTDFGRKLRIQINTMAVERNRILLECLPEERRSVFLECVELLTAHTRTMLAEELLESGNPVTPFPTHELLKSPQNEKKPLLIDAEKLRSLHQQIGKLLGIQSDP